MINRNRKILIEHPEGGARLRNGEARDYEVLTLQPGADDPPAAYVGDVEERLFPVPLRALLESRVCDVRLRREGFCGRNEEGGRRRYRHQRTQKLCSNPARFLNEIKSTLRVMIFQWHAMMRVNFQNFDSSQTDHFGALLRNPYSQRNRQIVLEEFSRPSASYNHSCCFQGKVESALRHRNSDEPVGESRSVYIFSFGSKRSSI